MNRHPHPNISVGFHLKFECRETCKKEEGGSGYLPNQKGFAHEKKGLRPCFAISTHTPDSTTLVHAATSTSQQHEELLSLFFWESPC